ncbi:MAG: ATP-binding cassette domain-containing protein [Peptoniphilus sp.]|nr:ATP-binding cassette domain-containing protein [Peptoniphilus sp.]MDD7363197.1 ATP-binding cassette domain-containing protein [Bacillota bacterium]MDY6044479.1 ATP-binding cassette domain-containing protein [Peptoniphilus sp.]
MTDHLCLEVRNLTKYYRHALALDHIDLSLREGKVYGFIGKNGAGKTTFIRMITGLAFPTSGDIALFGKRGEAELQKARRRIGALVEGPSLYPFMSAEEHLKSQQIQLGIDDDAEIGRLLELVGLGDAGEKKARHYSLGMKQRLGIAMSLIGDPDFLIWDEPINGLDPEGIREIRTLIRALNKDMGKTLLISSHLLGELENTATDFIVIDRGRIVEEISKDALASKRKNNVYLATSDDHKALHLLRDAFPGVSLIGADDRLCLEDFGGDIDEVSSLLAKHHVNIREMRSEKESLEDYVFSEIGADQ